MHETVKLNGGVNYSEILYKEQNLEIRRTRHSQYPLTAMKYKGLLFFSTQLLQK